MPCVGMSWHRLAHLHKSSLSSITMSSLLYPDSLAPLTSAQGVSNPTTTKVTMPVTTTWTTAVPVSRLDVQITPRPNAEVFRQCRPPIYVALCSMGQRVSPITCLRHRVGRPRITSNWASVWVVGSAATVANSLWVANSNKNTGVATSRVLRVTITSKPCRISASFKWLRLPRKNGQNVVPNEDLVIICVVLLPAWPLCTPTRMMCPPLLFFLYLLRMVSTSMTKNLCYTYSSMWRSCRTRDVTFQISSTPFLINPTSDAFLTLPTSCQTSCLYLREGTLRHGILDNVWPTSSTTSKRTWLNTANLTSNSSSRGVSPSSPYLSLWLASIPFPTSPLLLLATGISVRTAWKLHDRQQTALRLALEHQSFSRRPGMAPLAIVPVTGWRQLHPTCGKFWQVPDSSFSVHGRQIPWENQHCLQVPRLLLAWLSGLLFQSHQIPLLPRQ